MTKTLGRIALAGAALVLVGVAPAATYSVNSQIPIIDTLIGQPPPGVSTSTIQVGETSTVSSVSVVLMGINHAGPPDLDIAVISPVGTKVVLMSDAGRDPANPSGTRIGPGVTLTFTDGGATMPQFITNSVPISTGTYKPSNYPADTEDPQCPTTGMGAQTDQVGSTTLSSFNGQPANGTWTLRIEDDCSGQDGELQGGWCLIINSSSRPCDSPPTAVSVSGFAVRRLRAATQVSWHTGVETALAGFDVYRLGAGSSAKVNRTLVRSVGGALGTSYRVVDRAAKPGRSYVYRLQAVHLDATRSWVASARLR